VFVLELQANDTHAALGRLLDQARVAGLKLASVSAEADQCESRIRAFLDVSDRDVVDRLALRVSSLVCVGAIEVTGDCCRALSARSAP
jgi:acetolactate synthase regulatory subunit